MTVFKKLRLLFKALCLAAILCIPNGYAQIAPSSCDPNYYDSMEARAWLEAEREISQNQNLIFKPDSVLEYTCFDMFSSVLSAQAGAMFSESGRWGTSAPGNMQNSLNSVVLSASNAYLTGNFSHSYLGGRDTDGIIVEPRRSAGGYNCDIMNQIWNHAKCMNFFDKPDQDAFFTFEQLMSMEDVRRLPPDACTGPLDFPNGNNNPPVSQWETQLNKAYLVEDETPWLEDNIETFFNRFQGSCDSSPALKTGITVRRASAPTEFDEFICLVPGCFYVPDQNGGGSCRASN